MAIGIALLIQAAACSLLENITIEPLIRAADLGPALVLFPVIYMLVIGFFGYWLHRALHDIPALSLAPSVRHILADNIYHHYHHSRAMEHWGRHYCSFFSIL
ncbi:hypothetical protein OAS19_04885 [Altererythrobacter sp.]|nr:hypothetical protein [Altererythrobacter sp.]